MSGLFAPAFKKRRRDDDQNVSSVPAAESSDDSANLGSETIGAAIPPKLAYMIHLQHSRRFYEGSTYCVTADCDQATGRLVPGYVIVYMQHFKSPSSSRRGFIYTCKCDQGIEQHERLKVTSPVLQGDFMDFYCDETTNQCLHATVLDSLLPTVFDVYSEESDCENDETDTDYVQVEQLCVEPLLVGVVCSTTVHLLQYSRRSKRLQCTCNQTSTTKECRHKKEYKKWCEEEDVSLAIPNQSINTTSNFKCVSHKGIPYPLTEELQKVYIEYETGQRTLPHHLVPDIPPSGPYQMCDKGFSWDDRDPVEEGWITKRATIYKGGVSVNCVHRDGDIQPIQG